MEHVLADYKSIYGIRNLFIKHLSVRFWVLSFIIIFSILLFCSYISFVMNIMWAMYLVVLIPYAVLPIIISEFKKIMKNIHKCKDRRALSTKLRFDFVVCLRKHKIDVNNSEQMDFLVSHIAQKVEEEKPSTYVKSGVLAAVLVPLWVGYISRSFSFAISFRDVIVLFSSHLIVIIMFWLFVSVIRMLVRDIKDSRHNDYKSIRDLLWTIRLERMSNKWTDIA